VAVCKSLEWCFFAHSGRSKLYIRSLKDVSAVMVIVEQELL
jgi:hypothetical protein